jgi:hypothetical protein
MPGKTKPSWYFDACIFLAWLNAEDVHGPAIMEAIRQMARDVDGDRVVVMTSVTTKTEVFHKLKSQWARDEYTRFCQRANVSIVNQDERVGDMSSNIREHYSRKGITLDTTDCIHLATAIIYRADFFYTLDGYAEKPKANALLPLSGNVAGYRLVIDIPRTNQGSLFTGIPQPAVSSAIEPPKLKVVASNRAKLPPKPRPRK